MWTGEDKRKDARLRGRLHCWFQLLYLFSSMIPSAEWMISLIRTVVWLAAPEWPFRRKKAHVSSSSQKSTVSWSSAKISTTPVALKMDWLPLTYDNWSASTISCQNLKGNVLQNAIVFVQMSINQSVASTVGIIAKSVRPIVMVWWLQV